MKNLRFRNIKNLTYLVILASILLLISSCKTQRQLTKAPLKEQGAKYIVNKLDSTKIDFGVLSGKCEVKLNTKNKTTNFNVSLRIKKDSIIWMSISPALGIEIARVIINKDSIKCINRYAKNYFISDYNTINEMFKFNFDFDMIQKIILGNPYYYYSNKALYKASNDHRTSYMLNTPNRLQVKETGEKDKITQKLWINGEILKITQMLLNDNNLNRKLIIEYSDFKEVEEKLFPYEQNYTIISKKEIEEKDNKEESDNETTIEINKSRKPTTIKLDFSKIYFNKNVRFSFTIPEKYERIY